MKISTAIGRGLCLLLAWSAAAALATPPQHITTRERVLGTGEKGAAILRVEDDNRGSYYESGRKVRLIERAGDGSGGETSVLISETETIVDASHDDPHTPAPVTGRVISRDDGMSLAEVLLRYPESAATPWTPDQLARLAAHPASGIRLDGRMEIASPQVIARLIGEEVGGAEWKVAAGFTTAHGMHFLLEIPVEDEPPHSRVLVVGERTAEQVRAHLSREDIYLSAGAFPTREAAREALSGIRAKSKRATITNWEIWSRALPTGMTDHVLVLPRTLEMLRGGLQKDVEEQAGMRFEAVTSDRFREWMEVR